ncbi:MAG: Eco57I restriction-modification methylase domain-containing protein [Promethearchaeia archaeon]
MTTKELKDLIEDLEILFPKEKLKLSEIANLTSHLKNNGLIRYLDDLSTGSLPESALREDLFAGDCVMAKFFFGSMSPEVSISGGLIDYKIQIDYNSVLLEVKPLFVPKKNKKGKIEYLKQEKLEWNKHQAQIEKHSLENEYVILTNLKDWYIFSRRSKGKSLNEEPLSFEDFFEEFKGANNIYNDLERFERRKDKGKLDELFFKSLKFWVNQLNSVEFKKDISEKEKIEIIINLINKFVFIQTLDDYSVVKFQWIHKYWQNMVEDYQISKKTVIEEFFKKVNKWFFLYYNTELFKTSLLDNIAHTKENFESLFSKLELVLGVTSRQSIFSGSERGITNYNFREIDEDIFGKAYETYLAEVRDEQGIFYTPKLITKYVIQETVGTFFDEKIKEIKEGFENEDFERLKDILNDIITFRVLDPACGSGPFLIKVIRLIWKKYSEIIELVKEYKSEHIDGLTSSDKAQTALQVEENPVLTVINKIEKKLNHTNKVDLISTLILRHIHGNDLDIKALDVTKLNIWLEAIKLIPEEFRYDKIKGGKRQILPDLKMNLRHGDSLVGLPPSTSYKYIKTKYPSKIDGLNKLREEYMENSRIEGHLERIDNIIHDINKGMEPIFEKFLEYRGFSKEIIDVTVPFHWATDFWYIFEQKQNFDVVIGNPPYLSADKMSETLDDFYIEYLKETYNEVVLKGSKPDMYLFFIQRTFNLSGRDFSFIIPNRIISNDATKKFRDYILDNKSLRRLVNFAQTVKIFEDPDVHPCLLFLSENHNHALYSAKYLKEKGKLFAKDLDEIEYQICQQYNILFDQKVKVNIVEKISHFGNLEGLIHEGLRGKKISKQEYENIPVKEDYIQEFRGKNIRRYRLRGFKGYFYYPKKQREKDVETFENEGALSNKLMQLYSKLVFPELSAKTRVAIEKNGWVAYGGIYFISEKECEIQMKKLMFLLNSTMFNYLYRFFYESGSWGQSLKFRSNYLERIHVPNTLKETHFKEDLPIKLRNIRDQIKIIYQKVKTDLKDHFRNLTKILNREKGLRQTHENDKLWFENLSFYPENEPALLERRYSKFGFTGNLNKKTIEIYALKGPEEITLYSMQFKDIFMMQTVYFSLDDLFNSRKKIESLDDILSKTDIPVIKLETRKNTQNIMKDCQGKVETWLDSAFPNLSDYFNIILLDNKIKELDNKIDAYIFNQYELDTDDVTTILNSFDLRKSMQKSIIKEFEKLNE